MSCEHCTHCQDQKRREDDAAMLHPRGTRLVVTTRPDLGVVTYWRGCPEFGGRQHVVFSEANEDESFYIDTASLALAPEHKRTRKSTKI